MLFNNNHNNIINIIDRKLSKSIMLFKWKANIIKNKTKRKLTKITLKKTRERSIYLVIIINKNNAECLITMINTDWHDII